jgi:uncharacterized protein YwqG
MWSTRKELESVLAQAGLGEWSPRLAAAARHAMILEPGPVEEGADAPIGASRLGGMPDLPGGIPWPWRPAFFNNIAFEDHAERPWPLSFVAQIDFAEIHSAGGLEGFPSSGRLLFFCDPIFSSIGALREEQVSASVMFFTEQTARLGRRDFPVEFSNPGARLVRPKDFIFRPRRVTPKLWLLPPPYGSRELLALDGMPPPPGWTGIDLRCWGEPEYDAYEQFWNGLAAEHPNLFTWHGALHQAGGVAFPWQHAVEADCVMYADDDYLNHPVYKAFHERMEKEGAPVDWPDYKEASQAYDAFETRERATHFARAGSWQLVLQIETDDEVGPWTGEGCLYVCIRKSDLAERRFDRCWTMLQCT